MIKSHELPNLFPEKLLILLSTNKTKADNEFEYKDIAVWIRFGVKYVEVFLNRID